MRKMLLLFLVPALGMGCSTSQSTLNHSMPDRAAAEIPVLTPENVAPPVFSLDDRPDFKVLRETYGLREDFKKRCEDNYPVNEMLAAFDEKNIKQGVDAGRLWLGQCPVDLRVHTLVGYGYHLLGDEETARKHVLWSHGLFESILRSGDGKTPETAYVTISILEEYAVLRRWGLQRKSQALLMGPPEVDLLTVVDEQGKESAIYFNPHLHFVRLATRLRELDKNRE